MNGIHRIVVILWLDEDFRITGLAFNGIGWINGISGMVFLGYWIGFPGYRIVKSGQKMV